MSSGRDHQPTGPLDALRAVVCAVALLVVALSGFTSSITPARPDAEGHASLAQDGSPRAPLAFSAPLELRDHDLGEGEGEVEGGDCKPPKHRLLSVHGSTTPVALAVLVDEDPTSTRRRLASPSRAPPVA